jgi:hypothetical protein
VKKSQSGCRNHSCACWKHSRECHYHICACQNHNACENYTSRVEITLERRVIPLVSVIFTHILVKMSFVCGATTLKWKSYSACINQSCACWNYTRSCCNRIRICRNHTVWKNYTLRVVIKLERVKIILVSVIFTCKLTLVCVETILCG